MEDGDKLEGQVYEAARLPRAFRYVSLREMHPERTKQMCATLAGYKSTHPEQIEKTDVYKRYRDQIQGARAQIAQRRGYRMEDSARFYKEMSNTKKHPVGDRRQARVQLDKLLGFLAPLEVHKDPDIGGTDALPRILQIIQNIGVSPAALRDRLMLSGGED